MIRIDFEAKKKDIEEIFWKWFYKYHLKEFLKIIDNDINLQKLIFKDEGKYLLWKKDLSQYKKTDYKELKDFFFSLPKIHFEYCEKMKGLEINSTSEQFFKKRYRNFRESQAPKIVHVLDIHTCPYCNRNFLDIYYGPEAIKPNRFNGDIDHYFPQSKYPYLALCLYNLIPACKTCNHEKNANDRRHFHPYMDDHRGMYCFKTNFDVEVDIDYLYGLSEKFDIQVFDYYNKNHNDINNIKGSVEVFCLDDKYKKMTSFAKNIIRKAYIYNNGYLKDFVDQYSDILDEKEVIQILFDYEEKDFLNKPLSKFKYDLMKEFDVI